jgi:hypothetical protein
MTPIMHLGELSENYKIIEKNEKRNEKIVYFLRSAPITPRTVNTTAIHPATTLSTPR